MDVYARLRERWIEKDALYCHVSLELSLRVQIERRQIRRYKCEHIFMKFVSMPQLFMSFCVRKPVNKGRNLTRPLKATVFIGNGNALTLTVLCSVLSSLHSSKTLHSSNCKVMYISQLEHLILDRRKDTSENWNVHQLENVQKGNEFSA